MEAAELTDFATSVAGVTARRWGKAADARGADLSGLWGDGAAQGWFGLGGEDALDAALAATRELGRAACPLPLMDAFVALRVLSGHEKVTGQIADGELRVLVAAEGETGYLDGGTAATHVLTIPGGGGTVELRPITGRRELPGLAVPPWTAVELGPVLEPAQERVDLDPAAADRAMVLLRLGLAARAAAAAERAHEMAIEHAKARRQFGQPIGSFGAVQQRIASCHIDDALGGTLR